MNMMTRRSRPGRGRVCTSAFFPWGLSQTSHMVQEDKMECPLPWYAVRWDIAVARCISCATARAAACVGNDAKSLKSKEGKTLLEAWVV